MTQQEYALIVAGGKGTRLKSAVPKQFLEVSGKPVLLHTLESFYRYSGQIQVILVLPEQEMQAWAEISARFGFDRPLLLQSGGDTRFQSVKRGLEKIEGEGLVAIHDGVRPLVTSGLIGASFRLAAIHQSAICSVPLKDSLRQINTADPDWQQSTKAVDRSAFRLMQTPQTFNVRLIKQAYALQEDADVTDDATVFERAGHAVYLFDGNYENIKITTEEDLIIAEALLRKRHL